MDNQNTTQDTSSNLNQVSMDTPLVKKIPTGDKKQTLKLVIGTFLVVVLGVATGWFLSGMTSGQSEDFVSTITESVAGDVDEMGESLPDDDTAEGTLVEGGLNGEGTHHLDRNAGPDKMVYLTSTSVDLQTFVGKTVQVWGQTIAADDAPWLMDVSKIKTVK